MARTRIAVQSDECPGLARQSELEVPAGKALWTRCQRRLDEHDPRALAAALWQGHDPFLTCPSPSSDATYTDEGVESLRIDTFVIDGTSELPRIVVDAGAGDGSTTVGIARRLREHRHDGVVIAVVTWLGSWEDWWVTGR